MPSPFVETDIIRAGHGANSVEVAVFGDGGEDGVVNGLVFYRLALEDG